MKAHTNQPYQGPKGREGCGVVRESDGGRFILWKLAGTEKQNDVDGCDDDRFRGGSSSGMRWGGGKFEEQDN